MKARHKVGARVAIKPGAWLEEPWLRGKSGVIVQFIDGSMGRMAWIELDRADMDRTRALVLLESLIPATKRVQDVIGV